VMALPSSVTTSKVTKKSKEFRRKQAGSEHRSVERENVQMRKHGELCVRERNLLADQACYNSGSMVATKATLVAALLRETRNVWLTPGDGVVTAANNLASPPGTVPKRSAQVIQNYYRDWRNHDCQGTSTTCHRHLALVCFYRYVLTLNLRFILLLSVPLRVY
jgi:hypothetical protein